MVHGDKKEGRGFTIPTINGETGDSSREGLIGWLRLAPDNFVSVASASATAVVVVAIVVIVVNFCYCCYCCHTSIIVVLSLNFEWNERN